MSRRQRKNRKLNDSSSGTGDETEKRYINSQNPTKKCAQIKPAAGTRKRPTTSTTAMINPNTMTEMHRTRATTPPLKEHTKLNIPEWELARVLRDSYILKESDLLDGGFPLPCKGSKAFIYIRSMGECFTAKVEPSCTFDVNAQIFVPTAFNKPKRLVIVNKNDGLSATETESRSLTTSPSLSGDSGQGSGSSSPPSGGDSDIGEEGNFVTVDNKTNEAKIRECLVNVKSCVRCHSNFYVNESGDYYSKDSCYYHPGKQERLAKNGGSYVTAYSCCGNPLHYQGCTSNKYHVWTGLENGYNGPYDGFVTTQQPDYTADDDNYGVYAIDCEMCYTLYGLELTKVTLIKSDGRLVYEKLVKPTAPIVDYNTRFSGITEKLLSTRSVKTLQEVQIDLLRYISARTILIGHAINNDLRVLKMIHRNVIDTSVVFPHRYGLPYRLSLKHIVKNYLHRDIQTGDQGHCSFEDSRACLEALLWNVRRHYRGGNSPLSY